jgi:hypothetical protein
MRSVATSTLLKFTVLSGLVLLGSACPVVKPWERGQLAQTRMSFEPDPLETNMNDHTYYAKEGSSSGSAVTGGGCGCN